MNEKGKLPEGWERLSDIAELITKGTTPTTLGFNFQTQGINFIKIESIDESGTFLPEKFSHISEECHSALSRSQLKKNDILFSIAGALGQVAIVNDDVLPANTNQANAIIRIPEEVVDYNYLVSLLKSDIVFTQFDKLKRGNGRLNLSLEDIQNIEIPLPPLAEQSRIAAIIDAKVSSVEKAKKAAAEQQAAAGALAEAYLGEVFDFEEMPEGWKWVRLGEVYDLQMGKTPSRAVEEYWHDGTNKWISIADLSTYGKYTSGTKEKITDRAVKESRAKFVPKNTLIMSFKLSLGKTSITTEQIFTNEAIMSFLDKNVEQIHTDYIYYYFLFKDWYVGTNFAVKGATLNKDSLSNTGIPLPPLAEQQRIVTHLETKLASVEKIKTMIQSQCDMINALPAAILRKAFAGEM